MSIEWAIVPKKATREMCAAAVATSEALSDEEHREAYAAMLAAAPEPPHTSMTAEEARTFQDWAGMDGATAFHLIERHAYGWVDVGRMMDAWLQANMKMRAGRICSRAASC